MSNINTIVRFLFFLLMLFRHECSSCTSSDHCHISVITNNEERDLELFDSSNQSNSGIFSILDNTYTISGRKRLMHNLKNPTTDVEKIKLFQKQIKKLIEEPALIQEIQALLAQVKAAEQDLVYFIDSQEDPVAGTVIDTFYFKNRFLKKFNKSSIALDSRNYLKQLGFFSPVIEHLFFHFALSYIQQKLTKPASDGDHYHHYHYHHHDHHDHCCIHDLEAPMGSTAIVKGAFTALKAAHLGMHLMSVKEMVQQMGAELAVLNKLYIKISSVKECLHAINKLHACMQENDSEIIENISVFNPLLGNEYFSSKSSLGYLSPIGNTLYIYQFLKNNASSLKSCMDIIADIDVIASVAKWYKEHDGNSKAPVCFVEFITAQKPIIRLDGVWHIGLNSDSVILNNISLSSENGPYKFIITGPNKSGKSTIIKAVGLNIILAQTFGIATAQNAQMTIFHALLSYITVTDDLMQDRSTFVAELIRAEQCIKTLQSLQPDQHACLLVDDSLFKGTNFEKSQSMALRFLNMIGTFSNSCALFATHCDALTQLAKEQPAIFKNYCIKMKTDGQNNSQSMFTLEEGISNQSVAFDIIKKQHKFSF